MKKVISILALICVSLLFLSTTYYESYYGQYLPVFMPRTELNKSVFYVNKGRALKNPGKIYYKSPYIYVTELYKGVHVINNSNPNTPINEAFIVAPGCVDIAIKDDNLYLDNAVDLVTFNLQTKQVTKRLQGVLPEPQAPVDSYVNNRPDGMILVGWIKNTGYKEYNYNE